MKMKKRIQVYYMPNSGITRNRGRFTVSYPNFSRRSVFLPRTIKIFKVDRRDLSSWTHKHNFSEKKGRYYSDGKRYQL